jgi:ribosome-associated protein
MEELPLSKSEQKRRALRLQSLGRELTELKPAQLCELTLPDQLAAAVADYQRFPSREARRRQLQYIGRLMRGLDPEPIESALESLRGNSAQARYEHHQIERWRERLLEVPEALTEFLTEYPAVDRQSLRHHLQSVRKAGTDAQQRAASRQLFRFLKAALQDA